MIQVDRGPEPADLPPVRARRLARAVLARRDGKEIEFKDYNSPGVRERLYERQYSKCAYCERQIGKNGPPIEHFRPRQSADRGDPFTKTHQVDKDRYWWLAWSWNNLLLGCSTCNSAAFKGNWFPLVPGSPEVPIPDGVLYENHPCFAVGLEQPLLIDPTSEDPLDHMVWRPLDPRSPDGAWRAFHKTERGRVTIHILGLDGRNVDRVGEHILHVVKPWADRVATALEHEQLAQAQALWNEALIRLFAPAQPLHAATYDALAYIVPASERERAGLVLHRPGPTAPAHAASDAPTASVPMPRTSYAGLPDEVVLQLLADERNTPELIALICQARPSTVDELATLLEISIQTVKRHCVGLASRGELVLDANGRYSAAGSGPPEAR